MAKVDVEIFQTEVEGDRGDVDGLALVCERCGLRVEVFGTSGASARRGAAMLREKCLEDEDNYYDVSHWE